MQQWSADGIITFEIYNYNFNNHYSCNDYFQATINLDQSVSYIDYALVSEDSSTLIPLTITNDFGMACSGIFEADIVIPDTAYLGSYHFVEIDSVNQNVYLLYENSFFVRSDGGTDPAAANYNQGAIIDDGSCIYCDISNSFLVNHPSDPNACDGVALSAVMSTYPISF